MGAEVRSEGFALKGEVERGLKEAERAAAVEAPAFVLAGVDGLTGDEAVEGVHQPELAGAAGRGVRQDVEELWGSHEAANGREVGGRFVNGRFLDDAQDFVQPRLDFVRFDDAVLDDLFARHLLDGENGVAKTVEDVHELADGGSAAEDDVVRKEDGERLIADEVAGNEDGVAVAQALLLADESHGDFGGLADSVEELLFAGGLEDALELKVVIEEVFDGALGGAGDHDDLFEAGGDGFFDDVLDDGAINEREHLLGDGLGGREEAGAVAGGEDNGLADLHAAEGGFMVLVRG